MLEGGGRAMASRVQSPESRGLFRTDTLWRDYKTIINFSNDKTMLKSILKVIKL